jgi:hypothetical protein
MLIKLTVKNFLSFKEKTIFTMVASAGGKYGYRMLPCLDMKKRILPLTGIFGGEGTGNENLARALRFFKAMVTETPDFVKTLNLYAFQNYSDQRQLPIMMGAEFLAGDHIYLYDFVALQDTIIHERLIRTGSGPKTVLFERRKRKIKLNRQLGHYEALRGLVKSLPRTQLFLAYTVQNGFQHYREVYDWFAESLQVSGPDSGIQSQPVADRTHADPASYADFVDLVDRNSVFCRLDGRVSDPSDPVHEAIAKGATFQSGSYTVFPNPETRALEVYYRHSSFNEHKILKVFPFEEDSPLDYYPITHPFEDEREKSALASVLALAELSSNFAPRVHVNTRFDSSFDLILAHQTLSGYLDCLSSESRSQFILTLGNALLLDKKIFRPDEIWITERGDFGNTKIVSLSEYKKSLKSREAWKAYPHDKVGGIYTTLHIAALEVGALGK